ncbi:MAG: hypothetical protein J6Q52_02300 [Clostridia bacterium]|nr:hypothetical protein [Clostridia bacterium]
MKAKIGFLAFHILFALCQVTMSVLGMQLVSLACYIAGAVVVIVGLLAFLPGVRFWTGISEFGSRFEANNIPTAFVTMIITMLIGGAIAYIPHFLGELGLFAPIFSYLVALFVGLKIIAENSQWQYYLGGATRWMGKLVPCVYIVAISIIILPVLNPYIVVGPALQIILMIVASVFHLVRTILVVVNDPF